MEETISARWIKLYPPTQTQTLVKNSLTIYVREDNLSHNSILKKSLTILLIILFLMLGTAIAIASISAENYPVKATFSCTFYVHPSYINIFLYGNYGVIRFSYWSNYGIVEPQYSSLYSNRLRVLPEDEGGIQFNVRTRWFTSSHGGISFEASSYDVDLPYPGYTSSNYNSESIEVNVTDIIVRNSIINDTIDAKWQLDCNSIIASVADQPTSFLPLNHAIINRQSMECDVYVTVRNGVPAQVSSGNMTINGEILAGRFYFQRLNSTHQDSLDVPNPSVLQAKQDLPYLLEASIILVIAIVPMTYYYSKSKQIMNNDTENKADSTDHTS